jgi:phosphoribosylformimino-5-aminoimidazole carboxamide ribotide isomerase
MTIIPALDLLEGAVVRLRQGSYDAITTYPYTPLNAALQLAAWGMKRLHLVDLSGARSGVSTIPHVVADIVRHTGLVVDVGGGIRSVDAACAMIDAGAAYVCLGSIAVEQPAVVEAIAVAVGMERIIVALDCNHGNVKVRGWEHDAGLDIATAVAAQEERGIGQILVTEITRDGMMTGPDVELYRTLAAAHPSVGFIASGGIRHARDCRAVADAGCQGAVVGRAWLDGTFDLTAGGTESWS